MKRSEMLFAAAILLFGAGYLAMALQMPQGRARMPGPGFYPVAAGTFLVAASLGYLLWGLVLNRTAAAPEQTAPEAGSTGSAAGLWKVLALTGVLGLFAFLLFYFGYTVAIGTLLLLTVPLFGMRRVVPTVVISSVTVLFSYVMFIHWLKIAIPKSPVDRYLDAVIALVSR